MDGIDAIVVSVDCSELLSDIESIESGEMELPSVSAIRIVCNSCIEDVPLWLPEA